MSLSDGSVLIGRIGALRDGLDLVESTSLNTPHPRLGDHQRDREDRPEEGRTGRRDETDPGRDCVGREQESLDALGDGQSGGA